MEHLTRSNTDGTGLANSSNTSHENYWETLPDAAGPEYAEISRQNQHELAALQAALRVGEAYAGPGRLLPPSQVAAEWYKKLGTHNSLYGAREDLLLATRTVCSPDSGRDPRSLAETTAMIREDDLSVVDANKLLAMQMLLDANRDPSPSNDPMMSVEALNLTNTSAVGKGSELMVTRLMSKAEGTGLRKEEQAALHDALKLLFEARFLVRESATDTKLNQGFQDISLQKMEALDARKRIGVEELSEVERRYQYVDSAEEFKEHILLEETRAQIHQLKLVGRFLTNGQFTEHYCNLLLRHSILTDSNRDVRIASTTARQDAPHDGIFKDDELGRLSHDTTISGYRPNETMYVQLKAGNSDANYHRDIVRIDPFAREDGQVMTNTQIRQEAELGLDQLGGALAEYLGGTYKGDFNVIEAHIGRIKKKLDASASELVVT